VEVANWIVGSVYGVAREIVQPRSPAPVTG